ncbi:MAG TPA: aminofutalosine synthase MqnE [Nitrospirae bacterium]|nr:aminofutalosine synthase MqnE [Nitrospirota bacterium]
MIETALKQKILAAERVSSEEAEVLFNDDDIHTLGELAAAVAERKNGRRAYFVLNRHVNPTNICINRCRFCAFSRSKGEEGAFELSVDEILEKMEDSPEGIREVHIVGGLHPDRPFEYYLRLLQALKGRFPGIHIKAFTAVEVDYLSRISGLGLSETLLSLKESGLDAMPGGGAEIFAEGVRRRLCPEKISAQRWLEVHRTAHLCGIRTNATMLYGHLESYADRVEHLLRLRELQDETGGFQAFIPLSYHPRNTDIGGLYPSGLDDLKTIAVSRIVLDNFDHIKAYWIMLGEKLSQVALLFGADDVDGTVIEERITHAAGAMTGEGLAKDQMIHLIRRAGKTPVERDAFYEAVKVHA